MENKNILLELLPQSYLNTCVSDDIFYIIKNYIYDLLNTIDDLKSDLKLSDDRNFDLINDVIDLNNKIENLENEKEDLENEISNLENKITDLEYDLINAVNN